MNTHAEPTPIER